MPYHSFQEITIERADRADMDALYHRGFVITRRGSRVMRQVRSVRVACAAFQLSSENRRVLKKHASLVLTHVTRARFAYHWRIGKMAKDFYAQFGEGVFSANMMKALCMTDTSPMNAVLTYRDASPMPVGYALLFETAHLAHYAYPFYDLARPRSLGMAMMIHAVEWATTAGKEFIYLGSIQDTKSLYKFQFKGIEWFDGKEWRTGKPKF